MPRLRDVIDVLEGEYSPASAQDWDAVGLVCGDPDDTVQTVLLAVDPVLDVVAEAERIGADLVITHHPLLLRGVHSVAADGPKGAVVHRLIRAGCALYVAHTNADAAAGGVNEALAGALGLKDLSPLSPAQAHRRVLLVTYSPAEAADAVLDAAATAGAGTLGEYTRCAYVHDGTGTFDAGPASSPAIGTPGQREQVAELRIEMVLAAHLAGPVAEAVRAAHPYEEVPIHFAELAPGPAETGIGRLGRLRAPLPLRDFAEMVASVLPATMHGVRVSGPPDALIETVAVCGGSGDSLLATARASGADVFLTADLRHHPASEAREAADRPYLIDVAHWASEWPWLVHCARLLRDRVEVETTVSTIRTDPWTFHIPSSPPPGGDR